MNIRYHDHILRNGKKFAYYFSLTLIIAFVIIFIFENSVITNYRQYNFVKNSDYDYVVENRTYHNEINTLYKLDTVNSISKDGKRQSVITYLQLDNNSFSLIEKDLKKNEIVVSKNIMKSLNLEIGDTINVDLVIWEESKEYIVVDYIDTYMDFYSFEESFNYPIICMPKSVELENSTKGKYISFFNTDEYNDFISNDGGYIKINEVKYDLKKLFKSIVLNITIEALCLFISLSYLFFVLKHTIIKENKKYIYDNYELKKIENNVKKDLFIVYLVPLIFVLCVLLLMYLINYATYYSIILLLIIIILYLSIVMLEVNFHGKHKCK